MVIKQITFGGRLQGADLDIIIFPFSDKVLQDEIYRLKSVGYSNRTAFMNAEIEDIKAILENITNRGMLPSTLYRTHFAYSFLNQH